jgi:hypothetical protein
VIRATASPTAEGYRYRLKTITGKEVTLEYGVVLLG